VRVHATQVRTDVTKSALARLVRIVAWVAAIALLLFVLDQLGVPVSAWIRDFFDQLRAVPAYAIVGGIALDTLQTVFAALAWLTILRAAFPDTQLPFRPVLASYAVAVALNSFLPANIGSLVMMLMFTTLITSATFAAVYRRRDPQPATTLPDRRRPARARKLPGAARDRRGVHGRVLDPRQLSLGGRRHRVQLDLQQPLGDAGRRGRQPGVQRRGPRQHHE